MAHMMLSECLQDSKVEGLPDTAYYIPNFLTQDEAGVLHDQIHSRPVRDWRVLSKRRLQAWPSALDQNRLMEEALPTWLYNPIVSRLQQLPLQIASNERGSSEEHKESEVAPSHIFQSSPHGEPNHVLINVYEPGVGIMPHTDGPAYHPVVATVSLEAPIVLDIHERSPDGKLIREPKFRILQEPRSLLITTDRLYTNFLHGIADVDEDRDLGPHSIANWTLLGEPKEYEAGSFTRRTRTSLTYRDVPRTMKHMKKLFPGLVKK